MAYDDFSDGDGVAKASYRIAQNTLEPKNVDTVVYSAMIGLLVGVSFCKLFSIFIAKKQAVVAP